LYAYLNDPYPRVEFTYAGNWRIMDIWPQEYVAMALSTDRVSFSASDLFLFREISYEYDAEAGAIFVTAVHEFETDDEGISGATVPVPGELPDFPSPSPPAPPVVPPIGVIGPPLCTGRRMVATTSGVFATDEIGADVPVWYDVNDGLTTEDDLFVSDIKRDPWHWWTSGGTERTLWALTRSGIWKMENFPHGTWSQVFTKVDMGAGALDIYFGRMDFSIEVDGRFAVAYAVNGQTMRIITVQDEVIQFSAGPFVAGGGNEWPDVKWGQHSAGQLLLWGYNLFGAVDGVLRRSTDMGASWAIVDSTGPMNWSRPQVIWPYVSATNQDRYAYWTSGQPTVKETFDAGLTWSVAAWTSGHLVGTSLSQNQIFDQDDTPRYSTDGGASWTNLPAHGVGAVYAALVEWGPSAPQCVLIGELTPPSVHYWQQGMTSWVDKTGNLASLVSIVGGFRGIYQIDRDTMNGAA
ncbi:MAG: hypothetical protein ACXABY_24090, partial [Candidatus Thorarchaeota archaeon]